MFVDGTHHLLDAWARNAPVRPHMSREPYSLHPAVAKGFEIRPVDLELIFRL